VIVVEAIVALLLVFSGVVVLSAALGLLRFPDFFMRMHAPALLYTAGTWSVTLASILHFSFATATLALHTWLVIILLSITAPVTTLLLSRAAMFRGRQAGDELPAPLGESTGECVDDTRADHAS
jgi:multicomponent K+:H+ antiporter subunit G